jgi:5'-nucleotidase/UDP-sugar diphosphatase
MKVSKTSLCFMFILFFVCLLCSPTTSIAKVYHLTILHTGGQHGHFAKFSPYANPDVGGMAARSTLVNIVRAEVEQVGGHVLLLSAGNVNFGTPESDLLYAEPDFKLMKMLGYDAMALGNLDFSRPREVLMKQRQWAGFPFLSANIVKEDTGEYFVDPYIIKEFDGLKVAIFGLTLEDTPTASKYGKDLDARSVIETAKALVPALREKADLVIALTHIGFEESRAPGDVQLAKVVPGINVIVGGSSGTAFEEAEIVRDTLIVQAGIYGLYVGRLDLMIDNETDTITNYTYKLIPVNLKKQVTYHDTSYYMYVDKGYVEDPAVLEFIRPYLEQVDELLSQPIGEALVRLDGDTEFIRSQETNLANLITDSMRAKTGAEIAFFNAGGIRASIELGPITYRDILAVLPFGDTLVLLDMTGTQIMDILGHAATIKLGETSFLHVSGMTWTNKKGIPENVMVGDTPIKLDRMYKVVTGDFLAAGGDEYTMFKDAPQYDTGFTDASALREYIMKAGKVAPKVEGRLTIIE